MQQGRYAGRLIERRVRGLSALPPFRYFDKGNMAVVGMGYAVLQTGSLHLKGLLAWFAWMAIHVMYLAAPALRISVLRQWAWTFVTGQRGSRLIVNHHESARTPERNTQLGETVLRR